MSLAYLLTMSKTRLLLYWHEKLGSKLFSHQLHQLLRLYTIMSFSS